MFLILCHKVRRDTLNIFLINNESDMYFGLILIFHKSKNPFQSIPLTLLPLCNLPMEEDEPIYCQALSFSLSISQSLFISESFNLIA